MKLNPDFIPHVNFHEGIWLQNRKCPWFFFHETNRKFEIPKNREFYRTLDKSLKNLVTYLHSEGIPTTPSCSGHIKTTKENRELYNSLKNLLPNLKNGLILLNPETNRKFYYENGKFRLPWENEEFMEKIQDYQKKGVLGFVDNKRIYEKLKEDFNVIKKGNITLILTEENTEDRIENTWNKITQKIKQLI